MSMFPPDFDPVNNPIHALRMEYGDLDIYDYILPDASYQYFIDKFPDNPYAVSKKVGMTILAQFAKNGFRQRVGQEEAYHGERYKSYLDFLKRKAAGGILNGDPPPVIYIGGVLRDTIDLYESDPELIDSVFYHGQHTRTPRWLNKRVVGARNTIEYEERSRLDGVLGR